MMEDTRTLATASYVSTQVHPILKTLRTDVAALEIEAIKYRDQQLNRKSP